MSQPPSKSTSQSNASETDSESQLSTNSHLVDTQQCDGPCKKLYSVSNLKIYNCGHVICGNCFTELPLKGIDDGGQQCMLGDCRRSYDRARRSNSSVAYANDSVKALKKSNNVYFNQVQPPQANMTLQDERYLDNSDRSKKSKESTADCQTCGSKKDCQCCCTGECSGDQIESDVSCGVLTSRRQYARRSGLVPYYTKVVTKSATKGRNPDGGMYKTVTTTTTYTKTYIPPKDALDSQGRQSDITSTGGSDVSMPIW
ncbi:unnamed protein product [Bursaphelenchus okinawaensis]|uniref:Uncharacterized protein n=1 Tax=Bursaphelenchus okinawaensis TaxID=465554 RepID=A0A811LK63_9BILA|nr:unnamed protein product [Bursaphelenchus okinawaensis]CAG9125218.1 unnamed protein product [Bursaphelenchus okinawaensis]